jgi:tRNA modification GTPase
MRGEATVDEVIVAHPTTSSEDRYEVNCHGGVVAVQAVLGCLREAGAEVVEQPCGASAAASGQSALSPAAIRSSALASLQHARTRLAARMLLHQADGALSRALDGVRQGKAEDILRRLLETAPLGLALLTPPRVVLAGPPNVGKSTLLNALLKKERVIVHHRPGTTRDVVHETVSLRGVPFELIDSAGIREVPDELEREAVRRAANALTHCDVVLLLYDATQGPEAALDFILRPDFTARKVIVGNKIDLLAGSPSVPALPPHLAHEPHLLISARAGTNIRQVEAALLAPYSDQITACEDGGPVVFSEDICSALERMSEQLSAGSNQ